jgi:regulator of protease activity HflC (stomatin/prohibitin superfamily)
VSNIHDPDGRNNPLVALLRLTGVAVAFGALTAVFIFVWFFCRIEPEAGEIAVLIHKTGRNLAPEDLLATGPEWKGIQLDVLPEGRYFYNPYSWGWKIHKMTDIPAERLGVITRLFGDDLPPGEILATENSKGILREVLTPGKYRLNPYAYRVELFDALTIRPGHVGVKTTLTGIDVLNNDLPAEKRNSFLADADMKGVRADVLDPGSYYLNPYLVNVVEVNLQSQRFEMSGDDIITFLTLDGFTVTVEGTIEFGLKRDFAALLSHRVGDMDDIIKKTILPRARGFSRIEGSKYPAIDFIVGETRQRFQKELEAHLRLKCIPWGVDIKSVLIRKILVPDEIASISRDRELAVQDARKFAQQIEQAKSKAELVKQETLALQNKSKVEADTVRIQATISAEQEQAVQLIAANKDLGVAKLDLAAAEFQAKAVRSRAGGEEDAIRAGNAAEASVVEGLVGAFGSGINLARYEFYKAVGPRIQSVLSSDRADGIGSIFTPLLPAKGDKP